MPQTLNSSRFPLVAGSLLAGAAVALGAFGAHALEGYFEQSTLTPEEQADKLQTWEVAVRYQFYHALALLLLGIMQRRGASKAIGIASMLFVAGTAIFSGCLYVLVLSGIRILGAIVPLGGVAFLIAWTILVIHFARAKESPT